jgi:hypothetical protein
MTSSIKIKTFWVCLFILFFAVSIHAASILPDGLQIQRDFFPGKGKSIGNVQIVQGTAYMMHDKILKGYRATENMPVYAKDTLFVMEQSRICIFLNDKSSLTFGSKTKMTFSRMEYVPASQYRAGYSILHQGTGRFRVKDYKHFKQSSFSVKTPTALVGVRGSDFIIRATLKATRVETMKKTRLSLLSLADPDELPVLMDEFEWALIEKDALPSAVESLSPDEIDSIQQEFDMDVHDDTVVQDVSEQSIATEKSMNTETSDVTTDESIQDRTEKRTSESDQTENNPDRQSTQESDESTTAEDTDASTDETNVDSQESDESTKVKDTDVSADETNVDSQESDESTTAKDTDVSTDETNVDIQESETEGSQETIDDQQVDIEEVELPEPDEYFDNDVIPTSEDDIAKDETVINNDLINDKKEAAAKMPWFPDRP